MRVPNCDLAKEALVQASAKLGLMFPPQNGGRTNYALLARSNGAFSGAKVPAVLKAFKLLDIVSQAGRPLGVSELARRLELGKSTVHGLVTTLETLGVLETVNGSRKYVLGPRLSALSSRGPGASDLRTVARPVLERLAETTEQTSFLGVPAEDHVTILDIVHGRPALSISAPVGSSIPLLAGAVGKVILSTWDPQKRANFLHTTVLPAFTSASATSPEEYERAIVETVTRGAAIDVDEYVEGVRAAAAAVKGANQKLVAVLWVAGFARHIDLPCLESIASVVATEALELSRRLA
jgi:IclR family transcriptional regulator, KDG regulon repressor